MERGERDGGSEGEREGGMERGMERWREGGREANRQPDSQSDRQAKLCVDSNLAEVVIAQVASASNVFRQRNAPLQDGCSNGKYKCWASNSEEEEDEEEVTITACRSRRFDRR